VYHVTQDGILVHNNCINDAGKRGEEIALKMAGLTKNTGIYHVNHRKRIPDAISPRKYIVEIKNVKYQHLSRQLRDYIDIAENEERKFVLLINEKADISGPLQRLADLKIIKIIPIPM